MRKKNQESPPVEAPAVQPELGDATDQGDLTEMLEELHQPEEDPPEPLPEPEIVRMELPVDALTTPGWNPNEMSPEELALLKDNITEAGFVDPLTVVLLDDGKYAVVGGAHRLKAVQELGRTSVVCDVVQGEQWKSEDFQKFQNVRLNVIHGKLNPEKFLSLFNEMAAKYGKDKVSRLLGFSSDAGVKKIIKNVAKELRSSLPPEMAKQFEEKAKEARTVGDLERIIQHLFQEHGDSVRYNFMVFAWGGKEHVYVSLTKENNRLLKIMLKLLQKKGVDINAPFCDFFSKVISSMEG